MFQNSRALLILACGRLPESGDDLASQPTLSRWENAPDLRTLIRLTQAMVDLWCKSHRRPPRAITLDIDDTADTVHGHQQLSLFNAHYDERCFMPVHVYDADTGHWQVNRRGDVSGQLLGESKVSCGLMDAGLLSPDAERRGTSAPIACRSHEMTARS